MTEQSKPPKVFLSHTSEMAEYPAGRSFVDAGKDARGMMEFYCGLHLGRHATDPCREHARRFANSSDWQWAWRFAIELPEHVADADKRTSSLAGLFRRPTEGRRPNELMYRAWGVMERTPAGRDLLAQLQGEYRELLSQGDPIARQIEDGFRPCPPDADRDPLTFRMGSPDSDQDADDDEKPQVEMTVEPFQLAAAPTTQRQYWLYDRAHEHDAEIEWMREYSPQDDCPVIGVTWYDAWCFARWCGSRLPTEVEWEYACRAETTSRYWWGDEMDKSKCTFRAKHTTPASASHANPWGLMELSGNVWEWCETWFHEQIATANQADFVGESRVLRGGSFGYFPQYLRSAFRFRNSPVSRTYLIGFRISRTTYQSEV